MEQSHHKRGILTLAQLVEHSRLPIDDLRLLPICHTSSVENVRKILMSNKITGQTPDPYTGELLVYFFYGRARYIPKEDFKDEYKRSNPPIAFLYELESIPHPQCLYPFDSGGYHRYKIERDINEFRVNIIGVEEKGKEIKSYLKEMYSCNDNYLEKQLTISPNKYPWCTPLVDLEDLYIALHNPGIGDRNLKFGEQAYTMEIRYKEDIPLTPMAVILPKHMMAGDEATDEILSVFNFRIDDIDKRVFTYDVEPEEEITDVYKKMGKKVNLIIENILNPQKSTAHASDAQKPTI